MSFFKSFAKYAVPAGAFLLGGPGAAAVAGAATGLLGEVGGKLGLGGGSVRYENPYDQQRDDFLHQLIEENNNPGQNPATAAMRGQMNQTLLDLQRGDAMTAARFGGTPEMAIAMANNRGLTAADMTRDINRQGTAQQQANRALLIQMLGLGQEEALTQYQADLQRQGQRGANIAAGAKAIGMTLPLLI